MVDVAGGSAPHATGTSTPIRVVRASALSTPASHRVRPVAETVTARTSTEGWSSRNASAMMSPAPMSVSTISGVGGVDTGSPSVAASLAEATGSEDLVQAAATMASVIAIATHRRPVTTAMCLPDLLHELAVGFA